jgi:hypothetical protein
MTDMSIPKNDLPAPAPRRGSRRWLRPLLWLVIFASGFAVGTGVTLIGVRNAALFAIHHPQEMPARVAQRLRRPLGLSAAQVQQVEQILVDRQQALQKIRAATQPQVEAELDLAEQQIAEVLNAPQRDKWQRLFHKLRSTWIPVAPPGA